MTNLQSIESQLSQKIITKKLTVCIIGLGYVGLPLALTYAEKGIKVIGIDIDTNKLNLINSGKSYIHHIDNSRIEIALKKNNLIVTNEFSKIKKTDAIILCVPTPLNQNREPDLRFIRSTMQSILPFIKKGQILSLESTTYPGTTEEEIKPLIIKNGLKIGFEFFLVYSPEREDPGNKDFNTSNIPKVIGGDTENCRSLGNLLYKTIIKNTVEVSSTKIAEMTKLLENIHRAVNIGLMNELKILSDKMGLDLYEVIRAAATKPFGFVPYYPGPGLGGHCIPIDPFYLTWKAREYGMQTHFIELAGEINSAMPKYVLDKSINALNQNCKPLKNSKVLILGITYKKNIDDLRESPAVEIMKLISEKGASIFYSDPYISVFPKTRRYSFDLKNTPLTAQIISEMDLTILATDHDDFDYELIKNSCNLLIDTRGRFKPSSKIIRA